MLCHVTLVRTDVLEECSTSIIRVIEISELGTTLAVTSNPINSNSSTSSLQNDLQDIQKEGKTTSTQKKRSAFTCKYMESYLKSGFIQ
jgi:hypothetical protein